MLGKLIKHEWKSTYKFGCLMLGALALITLFGWLSFQTPMWNSLRNGGSGHFSWLDVFGTFTLIMYVVLLIVVNYGILIYVGVHFYKTMYTDEGYLLHTLPVTKHEILGSKILVNSLWVLIVIFTMYLSILILGMSMISAIIPEEYTVLEFWRGFTSVIGDLFYWLGVDLGIDFNLWVVLLLLSSIVTPFVTVTTLFGAISIGQLASRHRVLLAIVAYIGITIGESIINSIIRSIITVSGLSSFGAYIDRSAYIRFFVELLVAVGLYFTAWHISSHKLNMD